MLFVYLLFEMITKDKSWRIAGQKKKTNIVVNIVKREIYWRK